MNRRGFTLVEMVVVVGLLGIVFGAIYQAIIATQLTTSAQVQRIDVQQNTRAAALYMSNMLRELDAAEGDILISQTTSLRFRAMRWTGIVCALPAESGSYVVFTIRKQMLFGTRGPNAATDSIFLFQDGNVASRADDHWLGGALHQVSAGVCDDGSEGIKLGAVIKTSAGGNSAATSGVTMGSPARGFQAEELALYPQGADYWLGRMTADRGASWTTMRPLVGPLTSNGLSFSYFDVNGAPPALTTEIASIGVTIRGLSSGQVSRTGHLRDSILTRVTLRNNARF